MNSIVEESFVVLYHQAKRGLFEVAVKRDFKFQVESLVQYENKEIMLYQVSTIPRPSTLCRAMIRLV